MRKRQHIVLRKRITQRKRQFVVVIFTIDAVHAHIGEHVVHPAHVPFVSKAKPILRDGTGDIRIGRALLRKEHLSSVEVVDRGVELSKERNRIEVVVSAIAVGQPLAGAFAEVEVEHGAHRVHAKAVKVELPEPVHRAGDQKRLHLRLLEVKQERSPLRHLAAPGIGMLKQGCAVKEAKAVRVPREVRGHPVHDDADAFVMRAVDEIHQLLRLAVARRGGVVSRHLIAPARVIRIFHERHDFDVRVTHVHHVIDQFIRELPIAEPLLPAAEVYLIDIHRLTEGVPVFAAAFEIVFVRPLVIWHVADDGGRAVWLRAEGKRICLHDQLARVGHDCVFIEIAGPSHADCNFPNAGGADAFHRIRRRIPEVKRASHADRLRVWRPNGEAEHPLPIFANAFMAAKLQICRRRNATVKVIECCFVRKSAHLRYPRVPGFRFCSACASITLVLFMHFFLSSYHHFQAKGTSIYLIDPFARAFYKRLTNMDSVVLSEGSFESVYRRDCFRIAGFSPIRKKA